MPVTWCYDVEDGQKFCNPGFPIGCFVTEQGQPKDACVVNVSESHTHKTLLTVFFSHIYLSVVFGVAVSHIQQPTHILEV